MSGVWSALACPVTGNLLCVPPRHPTRGEMMRVWIDDEREAPTEFTHMVMSSQQAITLLAATKALGDTVDLVSFDHDLGYSWEDGHHLIDGGVRDDTSRPVMLWMIENNFWPSEIRFHTANPVGRQWLVGMAQRYAPESVTVGR